jgi:hypothetical protein
VQGDQGARVSVTHNYSPTGKYLSIFPFGYCQFATTYSYPRKFMPGNQNVRMIDPQLSNFRLQEFSIDDFGLSCSALIKQHSSQLISSVLGLFCIRSEVTG